MCTHDLIVVVDVYFQLRAMLLLSESFTNRVQLMFVFVDMLANVHLAVTNLIRYVPGQVISNDKQMVSECTLLTFVFTSIL